MFGFSIVKPPFSFTDIKTITINFYFFLFLKLVKLCVSSSASD